MILRALDVFTALAIAAGASPIVPDGIRVQAPFPPAASGSANNTSSKVNVSLYVMSRCPDARICENIFEEVLRTKGVMDKVDLRMDYIGRHNTSSPLHITCPHGPLECRGNIHQLCLQRHLPLSTWYPIISCMNYHSPFPDLIGSLDFTKQCVKTVGIDWHDSGVGGCVEGKHRGDNRRTGMGRQGVKLLVKSVERSRQEGAERSCTIRIGGGADEGKGGNGGNGGRGRECVVDGGVWKGCDDGHTAADFVRVIEEEWDKLHRGKAGGLQEI